MAVATPPSRWEGLARHEQTGYGLTSLGMETRPTLPRQEGSSQAEETAEESTQSDTLLRCCAAMSSSVRFALGLVFLTAYAALGAPPLKAQRLEAKNDPSRRHDYDQFRHYTTWPESQQSLLSDLQNGRLDKYSCLAAAMNVAGHDRVKIDWADRLITSFVDDFRKTHPSCENRKCIRHLFSRFAGQFLQGSYRPELWDVVQTLENDEYNCLTATILFHNVCQRLDIELHAIWEPSHVACWIPTSGQTGFVVETTAENAKAGVSTRISTKLLKRLEQRILTAEELLGKVFYNRAVVALHSDEFDIALGALAISCTLDPKDVAAQGNLRACINNWALFEFYRRDLKLAKELLAVGISFDSEYQPFHHNLRFLD